MSNPLWNRYVEANPNEPSSDFDTVTYWADELISKYEAENAALREENERIKNAAKGIGMVSELKDMEEAAVLVLALTKKIEAMKKLIKRSLVKRKDLTNEK
jgi:hypothetical protein